jgi:hypothetical protein
VQRQRPRLPGAFRMRSSVETPANLHRSDLGEPAPLGTSFAPRRRDRTGGDNQVSVSLMHGVAAGTISADGLVLRGRRPIADFIT